MQTHHIITGGCAALVGLVSLNMTSLAAAQIPDGAYVCSSLKVITVWPGDSGVFVAHPRHPGLLSPILDLPKMITYAHDSAPGSVGANCVLFDPSNRGVIVGTNGRAGQVLDLYRITLTGLVATGEERFRLGTLVANGGGVFELDWIDSDEVIAAVGAIDGAAGVPATVQVARIDLTTGVVAAVDLRGYTSAGFINAIAYDPAADQVYFGVGGLPGGVSEILAFTLHGLDVPALVATLPGAIRNLAIDAGGNVVAGLAVGPASGEPALVRVTPAGVTTTLLSTYDNVNAFAIERSTGQFALVGQPDRTDPLSYGAYFYDGDATGGGAAQELAIARDDLLPAGPLSGIDAAPSPVVYGVPSGAREYEWSGEQGPSRLALGGADWTAAVAWPNGGIPLLVHCLISTAPHVPHFPGFGLDLLIDPHHVVGAGSLSRDFANRQSTLSLQMPAALAGSTYYLQAFAFDFHGLSATPGLRVAVQ